MKQEIERFGFGDLNLGAIFNEGTDSNLGPIADRPKMGRASRMKSSDNYYPL